MTKEKPISMSDLFIFYGLLKQGSVGMPTHIDLEAKGEFLGPCRFRGRMFNLGGFPGAVAGEDLCHGVRYRLDDASILPLLDEFEDVTDDPATSLYIRERTDVLDDAGEKTGEAAWIYWYNQPTKGLPLVEDGNWPLDVGQRYEEAG